MGRLVSVLAGVLSTVAYAGPWTPDVRVSGNDIVASPAKQHAATQQAIEIVESESCTAAVAPPRSVRLTGNCAFLRGLYRYVHVPEEGGPRHQLLVEFSVTRQGAGHALLVDEPSELVDTGPPGVTR